MRGQRTERLVRLAAKFMLCPSKLVSLTDLAGKFGVRIEDTVLVGENSVQVLGSSDKNLIVL